MAWNYRTPLERKAISNGTRPPILRRLLIPADLTLCSLHSVLQPAMGWEDCHMHGFVSVDKDSVTPIRVRHSWRPGSSKRNALQALFRSGQDRSRGDLHLRFWR